MLCLLALWVCTHFGSHQISYRHYRGNAGITLFPGYIKLHWSTAASFPPHWAFDYRRYTRAHPTILETLTGGTKWRFSPHPDTNITIPFWVVTTLSIALVVIYDRIRKRSEIGTSQ